MLVVDADAEVSRRVTELRVTIDGSATAAGETPAGERYEATFNPLGAESTSWPYRFALVPKGNDASRRYRAILTAYEGTTELAVLRAESGFVKGKMLSLALAFQASCLGPASLDCDDSETCVGGECVGAGVAPGTLPRIDGRGDGGILEPPDGGMGTITSGQSKAGSGGGAAAGSGGRGAVGSGGRAAAGSGGTSVPAAGSAGMPVIHPGSGNCGDGMVNEDEACDTAIAAVEPGACPSTCTPAEACESTTLEGSGCQARCVAKPITALAPDDGCCPAGADANGDNDCGASCGNGVVETGETCDPVASCPSAASCTPMDACLSAVVSGDPNACTASCRMEPIVACQPGDGCCPASCTRGNDDDCSASCGDGVISAGETCEPESTERPCPSSCDDRDACTLDFITGSVNNCNVNCVRVPILAPFTGDGCCPNGANANNDGDCAPACGNGVTERGERCDGNCPAPAACDDGNACTTDTLAGADCTRQCTNTRVTMPSMTRDGCCPPGGNANNDADCSPACGNGVIESGEVCDGNCPTAASCDDNNPCTDDGVMGEACGRMCSRTPRGPNATTPDGCCPSNADSSTDADCAPTMTCGNGSREGSEVCDGSDCPTCGMCQKCGPECRVVSITAGGSDGCCPSGAHAGEDPDCEPVCGNSVTERGETCDAMCPTAASCNDSDPCTEDGVTGEPCNTRCTNTPIAGCCPGTPDANEEWEDPDCPPECGNGRVETGEQCDNQGARCMNCQIVEPPSSPDSGTPP